MNDSAVGRQSNASLWVERRAVSDLAEDLPVRGVAGRESAGGFTSSPEALSRSGCGPCRRVLDDLRDLLRMRQERDVARRDLTRRRAHPLRVEPLELRVDCPIL